MAKRKLTPEEKAQAEAEAKARTDARIAELVASAPPLSDEQVVRLRALLGTDSL